MSYDQKYNSISGVDTFTMYSQHGYPSQLLGSAYGLAKPALTFCSSTSSIHQITGQLRTTIHVHRPSTMITYVDEDYYQPPGLKRALLSSGQER